MKPIWFRSYAIEELNASCGDCLCSALGIRFTEIGDDYLAATMPVDERTRQPMGILHGGASVALAETLGSYAANLCVDSSLEYGVGQEINANHLRPVASGMVTGVTRPVHLGRQSHVWEIRISNEEGKLVCISRHTVAILKRG